MGVFRIKGDDRIEEYGEVRTVHRIGEMGGRHCGKMTARRIALHSKLGESQLSRAGTKYAHRALHVIQRNLPVRIREAVLQHGVDYAHAVVPLSQREAFGLVPNIDVTASWTRYYGQSAAFSLRQEYGKGRIGDIGHVVAVVVFCLGDAVVGRSPVRPEMYDLVRNGVAFRRPFLRNLGKETQPDQG